MQRKARGGCSQPNFTDSAFPELSDNREDDDHEMMLQMNEDHEMIDLDQAADEKKAYQKQKIEEDDDDENLPQDEVEAQNNFIELIKESAQGSQSNINLAISHKDE